MLLTAPKQLSLSIPLGEMRGQLPLALDPISVLERAEEDGLLDLGFDEDETCPYCGTDWVGDDIGYYCLDVMGGQDGDRFVVWRPCCEDVHEDVATFGYQEIIGRPIEQSVSELLGMEVLEVTEPGDSAIVCRLETLCPGEALSDRRWQSPKGWRDEVFADVDQHHRHHEAPQGHKFSVAIYNGGMKVGVAVVGRPVSRRIQEAEPDTLEVTRVCTWGHSAIRRNASSKLYAAAAKQARKIGFRKLITYTLEDEHGASLKAAGFEPVHTTKGESWGRQRRPRADKAPTCRKVRWERKL